MKSDKKTSFETRRLNKLSHVDSAPKENMTEKRTAKAKRARYLMTECMHILKRANNESQLLRDICLGIVENGGYRFAWVGYAQHDEAKTVTAVAKAGYEFGYLQLANITWDDTERGKGPTGTAIRSGQVSIMNDIHTNPAFAPWRKHAMLNGYQSAIAIPLRVEGQIIGSLNIYSYEADAFDAAEVDVLTQLGSKLALGISSRRQTVSDKGGD